MKVSLLFLFSLVSSLSPFSSLQVALAEPAAQNSDEQQNVASTTSGDWKNPLSSSLSNTKDHHHHSMMRRMKEMEGDILDHSDLSSIDLELKEEPLQEVQESRDLNGRYRYGYRRRRYPYYGGYYGRRGRYGYRRRYGYGGYWPRGYYGYGRPRGYYGYGRRRGYYGRYGRYDD